MRNEAIKVYEVDQACGPGPYHLSQREHTLDDLYRAKPRTVRGDDWPLIGRVWYLADEDGTIRIYRSNIDSSG